MVSVFIATAVLLTAALVLTALIPREAVEPRFRESAEYLCEGELFGEAFEGISSSRIDRYADSILLGIAWQYDSAKPLRSVLESAYYHRRTQNENENLREAVEKGLPANQQYLRYWHGSAGIVRLLMTFLSLPQIYVWHGILLALLAVGLLVRLLRRKAWVPAAGLTAGLIGAACWLVPLSLEYTWVFLILLVQLHVLLLRSFPKDWFRRGLFFLVSGMVTNYLDFLTCETLTLLAPLLFLLWQDHQEGKEIASWMTLGKTALAWLAGYAGMFLLKWGLAALAMGENVLPYVMSHIEERTVGTVGMSFIEELFSAPVRNLLNLFPVNYDTFGALAAIALLVIAAYFGYVYHRKNFSRAMIGRYAVIGALPYIRYLALANHSYLHAFFTFRAQLATLMAIVLILGEWTGWGRVKHGKT